MANNTLVAEQIEAYYGSTHDAELVLPLAMVTEHHGPNPAKKNTKKLLGAVMIRLSAAVASSALLFVSIRESSV